MSSQNPDHRSGTISVTTSPARRETSIRPMDAASAIADIRSKGKRVVTFLGFSGAGYEDPDVVARTIERVLSSFDTAKVIICVGGTPDGIGAMYPIAKRLGFTTIGIVSSRAEKDGAVFSLDADVVYVIADPTWGGLAADGTLSPVSSAMVAAADEMIAVGGGDIARDEARAAKAAGKPVRYIPADMNHAAAREKARANNQPEPQDFRGAVQALFADQK